MFVPMTKEFAREIAHWSYPDQYALYSFNGTQEAIDELLSGRYYVLADASGHALGFVCFGNAARIRVESPAKAYLQTAMDIGLGMAPDLCGRGTGSEFFCQCLDFALQLFGNVTLRLAVAAFNQRAIKVYIRAGFLLAEEVRQQKTQAVFFIMLRHTSSKYSNCSRSVLSEK